MFEILIYIFKGIFQLLMWTWPIIVLVIGVVAYQNLRKSKWVEKNLESVVLGVKIPKNSEKGPTSAEMMFASLHGILKSDIELKKQGAIQEHISFEMVADASSIVFYVWTPKHLQNFVEGQIYAQYPTAEISTVDDYSRNIDIDHDGADDCVAGCELRLVKPDYFPIKTFVSFEVDPLAGITGALSKIEDHSEKMWIQILTRPVSDSWRNKGLQYAEALKSGSNPKIFTKEGLLQTIINLPLTIVTTLINALFPPEDSKGGGGDTKLPHNVETSLACLEEKANKLGYQVKIRLLYIAKSHELAQHNLRTTAGAFKQFNTTLVNGFAITKIKTGNEVLADYRARLFTDKGFVLNIEEVASLYHLPHASVETPNIVWTSSKKGEPPANLPYADDPNINQSELTIFGETTFRGKLRKFGIKKDDRRRHMYVLGKSGVGKSKILEILAVEDIKRGEGVGIVDPHGELIHDVLKQIPAHRIDDVVYINPADKDYPVGFNPMKTTPELREGVASGFVSVFKKQFGYSWGPRLEYLMRYAILALTYYPDTTMLDVVKILTDKDFRKKVLTYVEDPVVKTFWLKEFSTYNDKFATEAVAPILNKVGQFTASPTIRNIIGQTKETFDFEDAMNSQKIILVDLSSGKIGEDNSELLGSLMITKMQLAAMARARIKPEDRKDFFLYVDEFQNFATDAFAKVLSEARKYRLSLALANQYVAQMEDSVKDAVFGNVGTLISFRVGADDASYVEKQFSPVFEKDDLIGLDNQHMYIKTLIDGEAAPAFSAKSIFIEEGTEGNTEKIIEESRRKYSRPRAEIEEQIRKWSNADNLDIDKAIDRQSESKFNKDDYTKEITTQNRNNINIGNKRGEERPAPQKRIVRKEDAPKKYSDNTQKIESVPVKKSVDPEQLKKIIQKLTQPNNKEQTIKKEVEENIPIEHSIPRTSAETPQIPKQEVQETTKSNTTAPEIHLAEKQEQPLVQQDNQLKKHIEEPKEEKTPTQHSVMGHAQDKFKKQMDEESVSTINKISTHKESRIVEEPKKEKSSPEKHIQVQADYERKIARHATIENENKSNVSDDSSKITQPIKEILKPEKEETIKPEVAGKIINSMPGKPLQLIVPKEGATQKPPQIKITKISGGAEVEKVSREEFQRAQAEQARAEQLMRKLKLQSSNMAQGAQSVTKPTTQQTPIPNPVSKFGPQLSQPSNGEVENIRQITREEFLNLKEILPNEKIVIVDKKTGETRKGTTGTISNNNSPQAAAN